jgi:NDP-sugar pyrophosphorylase family protein
MCSNSEQENEAVKSPAEVVILAGGRGTRLRPFTISIPKPLLPLEEMPIVEIVLRQLRRDGFRHICLSLGHLAPLIQNFFKDGAAIGLDIEYVVEDTPLGTAGALTLVPSLCENFIVQNGDTLTDLSYRSFLEAHCRMGVTATIFTQRVDERIDYGVVEFDRDGLLSEYLEKPTRYYYVSTGVYALHRSILDLTEAGTRLDMPDLLKRARADGRKVCCFVQKGAYWCDIGRFDHYEAASKDFKADRQRFLAE